MNIICYQNLCLVYTRKTENLDKETEIVMNYSSSHNFLGINAQINFILQILTQFNFCCSGPVSKIKWCEMFLRHCVEIFLCFQLLLLSIITQILLTMKIYRSMVNQTTALGSVVKQDLKCQCRVRQLTFTNQVLTDVTHKLNQTA